MPPGPCGPISAASVSKKDGGSRMLIRLDANDERNFSRAVTGVIPSVDRARRPAAFANRVGRIDENGVSLRPWAAERRRWIDAKDRLLSLARVVVITDVRRCYASMAPDVVVSGLVRLGAPSDAVETIAGWLGAFQEEGIRGLPIGPTASAILADAVLMVGDAALERMGVRHIRWVDDVAIFTEDRPAALIALDELRSAWRSVGLESHPGKTAVLDPDEADARLTGTSTSGPPALR